MSAVCCSDDNCDISANLETLPVSNVEATSVTLNGRIQLSSNCVIANNSEQGFVISTTVQPTINDIVINVNGEEVMANVDNLMTFQPYYARTFVTNPELGTRYGNEVQFELISPIYLDNNGVTIKASSFAQIGDTGVINGVTYTIVDELILRTMVMNDEDVTKVCTSKVENMSQLFLNKSTFNQDIGSWDISNVTSISSMFQGASSFNQDISQWNVANLGSLQSMFFAAQSFNQPIGSWDVSNVYFFRNMFSLATSFNQDLSNWEIRNDGVNSTTNMELMFANAYSFNQDISNWNVDGVKNMTQMFYGAESFNQDLSSWNVSNVIEMTRMFGGAISFNQDIGNWNVGNVTECAYFDSNTPQWILPKPNFTNCIP